MKKKAKKTKCKCKTSKIIKSRSLNPRCNYDVIRILPSIGETQFIDGGRDIVLLTNNDNFRDEYRTSLAQVQSMMSPKIPVSGMHFICVPAHKKFKHFSSHVIFLHHKTSARELLEVVVHEVSHLVDSLFEHVKIDNDNIDTEFRAYLNDYYCGKLFDMMHFRHISELPLFMTAKKIASNKKVTNNNNKARLKNLLAEVNVKGVD